MQLCRHLPLFEDHFFTLCGTQLLSLATKEPVLSQPNKNSKGKREKYVQREEFRTRREHNSKGKSFTNACHILNYIEHTMICRGADCNLLAFFDFSRQRWVREVVQKHRWYFDTFVEFYSHVVCYLIEFISRNCRKFHCTKQFIMRDCSKRDFRIRPFRRA